MNNVPASGQAISPVRAVAIVASNMIGTGVYTSLGLLAAGIHSVSALLLIWISGGLVALCGALVYGELAARMPQSGGEYIFLSKIYHPAIGFMSGFVSMTIGFAAPLAMTALAFGSYASHLVSLAPLHMAVGIVLLLAVLNLSGFRKGVHANFLFSIINILLILVLCVSGLYKGPHRDFLVTMGMDDLRQVFSPTFAVMLVYVSFAFSGWNSATYITRQIQDPERNLHKVLFWGTFSVMSLYTALNFIFLYTVPLADMQGKLDVAVISAQSIFGSSGGKYVASLVSIGLVANLNSLFIFGPRVTQAIAADHRPLQLLGIENRHGTPFWATILLTMIALVLLLTSTFEQIMVFIGFSVSLFTLLSVAGLFVLRFRARKKVEAIYRTFAYPYVPVFFILMEGCMAVYVLLDRFSSSLTGLLIVFGGFLVYLLVGKTGCRDRDPRMEAIGNYGMKEAK